MPSAINQAWALLKAPNANHWSVDPEWQGQRQMDPEKPWGELPFRKPEESPYQPFQPDIAMQIAMIEAQIQELLQKKAALEAQGGGGGGEGGAPSPNPYDQPPGPPPRPQGLPFRS